MPHGVRPFERHDRDQLTELVNLHIAAVLPGVAVSVNTVMSQLEREPLESTVDPWVIERRCLVATDDQNRLHAAALLHHFGNGPGVSPDFADAAEIRWLICRPDQLDDGRRLMEVCIALLDEWNVENRYADGSLPAPACYGVPYAWPHIGSLCSAAGFAPSREETVLRVRCADLIQDDRPPFQVGRSAGVLGTRFTLSEEGATVAFIEVCQLTAELTRSYASIGWADVGNLHVDDGVDPKTVIPHLYSAGAEWLLQGGIEMLIEYHSGEDPKEHLGLLEKCGFETLVTNTRGWATA
ncbi:MAG: N-acetyltransferase [Acidimicrobiia bacterium]